MAKVKKRVKASQKILESPFNNYWTKKNYLILGFGIFLIVIGYVLMTQGPWDNPISLTVAPLILLIAYVIIFPLSILYKKPKKEKVNE